MISKTYNVPKLTKHADLRQITFSAGQEVPEVAQKIADKLFKPGEEVVSYVQYADGCSITTGSEGSKSWQGKDHAPHGGFYPDDEPTIKWVKD